MSRATGPKGAAGPSRPAEPGRVKRFRIIPQEQGMTLRNVLARRVRELDRNSAAALIRAGGVYVNRLRIRLPQILVAAGERITCYPEALTVAPFDPEALRFVFRGPDFVVIDKPAGVPVSPVREVATGCLSEALIHKLESEGVQRPYVGVVHRLDRGASGLVLFTIRDIANKSLHKQFVEHQIRRRYRVRVRGQAPAQVSCEAPLVKRRDRGGSGGAGGVVVGEPNDPGAMQARTHFRAVAQVPGPGGVIEHLLDVELETGRTHQIRAHAAHLGFPVVGDHRYGPEVDPRAQGEREDDEQREALCLHAWQLDFEHPISGQPMHIETQLPPWARAPESDPQ